MSTYNAFYSCLPIGGFIVTNHVRVFTAIVFSQLVVLYFGFRMDVSLIELLTTVAVASLVEIIYHVKLVRKIGADISFETMRSSGTGGQNVILWQVTFVVLVSIIIMASNNAPDA